MSYKFTAIEPRSSLRLVVRNFFVIEFNEEEEQHDYLLPDGLPSFFYIQASDSLKTYFVEANREVVVDNGVYVGYSNTAVELTHKRMRVVGASIFPMFLGIIFHKNPFEFTNRFSRLDDMGNFSGAIESIFLSSATPYPEIIELFEEFINNQLDRSQLNDDLAVVYEKLTAPNGFQHNVADVASWLGCSSRHLNTCFRKFFGMSPKKFIKLVRFNHALREIYNGEKSLSCIAHESGYHDQSHFIMDFRKICGRTPKELLQNVDSLAKNFQLY